MSENMGTFPYIIKCHLFIVLLTSDYVFANSFMLVNEGAFTSTSTHLEDDI